MNPMTNDDLEITNEDEMKWKIEEPDMMPKTSKWFWTFSVLALALTVFAILFKNYLLIVIVALAAFIIYGGKNKKPELISFHLDNDGLYIGNKFYLYNDFHSFWIFPEESNIRSREETDKNRRLALRYKKHVMPLLIIPFFSEDEESIRRIFKKHLAENEEQESMFDLLRKRFF